MTNDGSRRPPTLATWAEVDPALHPFDAAEAAAAIRAVIPAPPAGPARGGVPPVGHSEAWAWVDAVGMALSDRYGPWAYGWYWGPGQEEQRGWIDQHMPTPAEAPAFVADELLAWRRWLVRLAERFDRFLPLLDPLQAAGPGDIVAAWEAAIGHLMMAVVAPVADDDGWQGWCCRVLQWFLTATGIPVERAEALVDGVIDERFNGWVRLTAFDIGDVAERLTRDVIGPTTSASASAVDSWPDTWPQGWPTWRATNTTGGALT